jgi:PHD/YefM family antitoxin component YafN of YafNO toxin-antitoxin module
MWRKNHAGTLTALCSEYILKYAERMTTPTVILPSSEISRNPAKVFSAAEKAPIGVSRRDGANLVLMSESENNARTELLRIAEDLVAVAVDERGTLVERMSQRFSWMLALSEHDRQACTAELLETARASFSTGGAALVMNALASWKATAEAITLGLRPDPADWLDSPRPAARPE